MSSKIPRGPHDRIYNCPTKIKIIIIIQCSEDYGILAQMFATGKLLQMSLISSFVKLHIKFQINSS